ncbi:MAG TPA: hypothetical protein VGI39_12110 [Polyangiaceae bacterium]
MTVHRYRRTSGVENAALLVAAGVAAWVLPRGGFATALLAGICVVWAWGAITLHFPRRVEIDDAGVTFFGYGRAHRFVWRDVTRVRVRRFLVRDRVLVVIGPAPAWRGRYWILDSIEGFAELLAALDAQAALTRYTPAAPSASRSSA